MDYWKKTFLTVAVIAGTWSAMAGTTYFAQVNAAETNVFLGQVFTVDVIVKAPELPRAPDVSGLAGFNVTVLNAGSAAGGTNTFHFRYAFRATNEGKLTIPQLNFMTQEETLSTQPVAIEAAKPEESDRMELRTELAKSSVYLGEPVLLTASWHSTYPFGALKAVDFHFPILNDKRFQVIELYEPGKEKQGQTTGLPVHGTRVLATRENYTYADRQYQSLSFSKILIPKKSGQLTLPPATLLCAAEQEKDPKSKQGQWSAFQYPAYFDNTFFDQNVTGENWSRIYTESTPLTLEVKPLPTEGRPDLFNGMVGEYTIRVEAEPTEVRVGEPITLTITVTAAEFMENIFFPPLRYQPLLVNRFEIPSDRSLPLREGPSKIYTQTIRPLSTSLDEVPPIQLAFFSPESEAYQMVQSTPVPLQVSPAEAIGVFGGSAYQNRLRAVEEGIRHNYENPDMLKSRRLPLFGWANPFIVLALLLLPPLGIGGVSLAALFGEKRHHIHRTAKAARAYSVFRKNAAHIVRSHSMKSEIYGDLDQVLRAYLGDRLHLRPGALSFRDAQTYLVEAGANPKTLEELQRLFALCEAYRFTSDFNERGDAKQIVREATRIVKTVERMLK